LSYHLRERCIVDGDLRFDSAGDFATLAACIDYINERPDSDFMIEDDFRTFDWIEAAQPAPKEQTTARAA
jgi:hypothetical protein